jgi:serine/threonine-protein kinase
MSGEAESGPSDASDGRPSLVGQVIGRRYQVESMIGTGGMGTVYRVLHVHMRKTLALKVLHRELLAVEEVVARFEREAIAAARIEHPNVAKATDFGRLEDGSFYLVMEFVSGLCLSSLLTTGSLEVERALSIAAQVAAAIGAAHEAGIVHRDLKPDNVMLLERDGDVPLVKVLDFGIAKVQISEAGPSSQLTRMGAVFGTPEYMAPEQAAGAAVDHRADLYALGVMLYEMLSGKPPFEDASIIELLSQQLTKPAPPLPDSVPEDVRSLVMALLAKDASERIQTAHEVGSAIAEILDRRAASLDTTQLALAAPEAPREAPSRKRLLIASAAAGTLLLLLAGALLIGQASEPKPKPPALLKTGAFDVQLPKLAKQPPPAPTVKKAEPSEEPAAATTQRGSRKASGEKQKPSSSKKKTGPGGIYIPPPSEWF